ncbi:MAG: sulfatase-like hydrolase/transferase [Candidatus Peribacteria bacterium]|jgi:glucan phosphoethanolaminetransferase (alkaline phosphatase superfamily)|nr:sulfatase-like hydrolase/transferase [Candidatus Peribacteria bacterium]
MVSDFLLLLLIVVLAFFPSFTKKTLVKILSIIIMFVVVVVYVIDIRVYLLFQSRVPLMEMGKFIRSLSGFFSMVMTNILVFVGCFWGIFFLVSIPTFKKLQRKILLLFFSTLLSLVGIGMLLYDMPVLPQNILQINLKSLQSFNTYLPAFSQENPSSKEKIYTSYEDYFTTEKGSNRRPNIIIVFAESFSPIDSLTVGGVYDNLPHFDTIAQDGIVFTNFVNNGCTSDTAHIALLRGIEPMGTASYTGFQTYLESLPEFLNAYGYNTTFLSSVSLDFLNQRSFLEHMKFDIVGEEAFSSDKKYVFDAAPDFDLYHKALDLISKKSDPYLLVMQTISAHKPYTTPYGNTSADALRYADEMLGGFYHVLNLLHFFDNGMLIIVGDHRKMDPQELGEKEALGNLRYARGLATIVGTGIHPGIINTTIIQHTDIFNGIRKLVATGNVLVSELTNDPF